VFVFILFDYLTMTNQEIFIEKYGEKILDEFLFELIYEENDCGDDLCDDEGCRSRKYFLQWLNTHNQLQYYFPNERAADSNED
jgi:hypothetical protein